MLFWLPAVRDGQLQGRPARVPALANDLHVLCVATTTVAAATLTSAFATAALTTASIDAATVDAAHHSLDLRAAGDGRKPDSPSRLCWRRTAAEPVVLAGWPQRRP